MAAMNSGKATNTPASIRFITNFPLFNYLGLSQLNFLGVDSQQFNWTDL